MRNKIELLAPAGDMERLEMAVAYGADAVYLAGTDFGMRSFAGNFSRLVGQQNIEILFPVGAYFYGKGLGHKKICYLLVFSQVFNKNFFHTVLSFNKHLSNLIAFIYYNTKGVLPQDI